MGVRGATASSEVADVVMMVDALVNSRKRADRAPLRRIATPETTERIAYPIQNQARSRFADAFFQTDGHSARRRTLSPRW
jgi:hypothetical protein